jgi:hypothetical protein
MNVFKLIEDNGLKLDGDIEHFAELVAQQEREACARLVEADGLARGAHGYMLIKAATRIRARGEFSKPLDNAVHASDISQERVDETAKDQLVPDGTIPISNGGIATSTPTDFFAPPKREWVGLSDKEVKKIVDKNTSDIWCNGKGVARDVEAKLKEKNHDTR